MSVDGLVQTKQLTIGGAAVGFERQRTGHATGPRARFGGIRTFTLLAGIVFTIVGIWGLFASGTMPIFEHINQAGAVLDLLVGLSGLAFWRLETEGTHTTA